MVCDYCGREFVRSSPAQRYCTDPECNRARTVEYTRVYMRTRRAQLREQQKENHMEIQLQYVPSPHRWRGRGPSECPECRALEDRFRQADAADVLAIMAERYAHMEAAHGIPYRREVEQLEFEGVR